jgi:hypothetical protein
MYCRESEQEIRVRVWEIAPAQEISKQIDTDNKKPGCHDPAFHKEEKRMSICVDYYHYISFFVIILDGSMMLG